MIRIALKKQCRCGKIIDCGMKYCDECSKKVEHEKKERNKQYDKNRKNDKEWRFYKTPEWIKFREYVLRYYNYIDIYCYYVENKIIQANTSHHIIELRENWNKRLNFGNQFPCSSETHSKIHKLYEKDKEGIQKLLGSLLEKYKKEMNTN